MQRSIKAHHAIVCVASAWLLVPPAAAQTHAAPPVFDQLASPFTESELGGIGCLLSSAATTGILVWLVGGPAAAAAAIGSVTSPSLALQGAAAGAFVYSSACYIGQALSPLGLLTYNSIMDGAAAKSP